MAILEDAMAAWMAEHPGAVVSPPAATVIAWYLNSYLKNQPRDNVPTPAGSTNAPETAIVTGYYDDVKAASDAFTLLFGGVLLIKSLKMLPEVAKAAAPVASTVAKLL